MKSFITGICVLACIIVSARPAYCQAESDYFAYPEGYAPLRDFVTYNRELTLNRLAGISEDYVFGVDDVLSVEVVGAPELDISVRVNGSGNISLPLIGEVAIEGLIAEEAESRIAAKIADAGLIVNPEVLVYITEYKAKSIYILGEIDRPGEFAMSQQLTLMDAVMVAGGIDMTAGRYGYLHRKPASGVAQLSPQAALANPTQAQGSVEVIKFDLTPLKSGGVLEENPALKSGDVIVVPRRIIQSFYVIGDVKRPGVYEIPPESRVLASQAIAWAGGPTNTSKLSDSMLVRLKDGSRVERNIDFRKILEGRQEDVAVEEQDVLFIPGSNAKTLGLGLLQTIPNTVRRGVIWGL